MRGEHGKNQRRLSGSISQVIHKQHAPVRQRVAMDQCTDIVVLRQEDPPFRGSFNQQRCVTGIRRPFAHIEHIVTNSPHRTHGLCNDVGVGKDAHTIRRRS